ncbi:Uma2 family endonuclease [Streptomyces sp. NPDC127112]|uniref:Uma2 family endonuclease n=1 Tax=Streptomyces sp. NPDC127112 TaxID=3345364 RepID=UPI00362872E3
MNPSAVSCSPQPRGSRPFHAQTRMDIWDALDACLPREWGCVSCVACGTEPAERAPDLAVIPAAAAAENRDAYPPELVALVVEVIDPGTETDDYETKAGAYARRGIPHYLIFDPYKAQCTTLWNPGPDGYRGRDVIPYGGTVVVESGIGKLSVDTAGLPVDPSAVS